MACKCINEDGSLSLTCRGTCKVENKIIEMENQCDPLNGFAELILAQVERRIDQRLICHKIEIQGEIDEKIREAFIEGIREGIKLYKEFGDNF